MDFKEGVKSKGFRAGQDTSLPEARSRRGGDGSGQVANMADGTDHAKPEIGRPILFKPHQWRPHADPEQKHDPGGADDSRVERSPLTTPGPLQKPMFDAIGLSHGERGA
jgi:hypothetical protein